MPLELEILEAAIALQREGVLDFHGYALAKRIRTTSDRRLLTAHGTLYRALHRLERADLLEQFWENHEEAEREGRPRRRLYRLTALAAPAVTRARARQRSDGAAPLVDGGLELT